MIKSYSGEDRVKALSEIKKFLGVNHETIDGETVTVDDIPSLFFGATFFDTERRILINDLSKNTAVFERLPDVLNTPHKIALLDFKIDKRTTTYKALKGKIDFFEYEITRPPVYRIAYQIYDQAKTNPKKALELLKPLETEENPIAFTGLLISKALKDYDATPSAKTKQALKLLAKTDLAMKSTNYDLWLLVETFLAQLSTF